MKVSTMHTIRICVSPENGKEEELLPFIRRSYREKQLMYIVLIVFGLGYLYIEYMYVMIFDYVLSGTSVSN